MAFGFIRMPFPTWAIKVSPSHDYPKTFEDLVVNNSCIIKTELTPYTTGNLRGQTGLSI